MLLQSRTRGEEKGREAAAGERLPPCPKCAGPLAPLHNGYRCCRCRFTLCAGCDAPDFCPPAGD